MDITESQKDAIELYFGPLYIRPKRCSDTMKLEMENKAILEARMGEFTSGLRVVVDKLINDALTENPSSES